MAQIPSEEHIRLFVELAPGLSRNEIILRIKGNNNDVEQALNEYYDNPNTNKYLSDSLSSVIDQETGSVNNQGISYRIQADDMPQSFNQYRTVQSRPPSRMNNNFPASNSLYSSTDTTTGNDLNNQEQDADLKKALALSAQEAGMISQDMDASSKSTANFGPATRELYDSNQWSIVPLGQPAPAEFNPDPDPSDRERGPDAPAFLKPSAQNHNLGALITIYHEIPMMRNNFLNVSDVLENYGYDKLWWNGNPITSGGLHDENVCSNLNRELQRLMAFLDSTQRSYGSVEVLASSPDVIAFSRAHDGSDKDCAFLEAWRQLFDEKYPYMIDQVFGSGVASEETENDEKNFAILELNLPNHSFYENLYDICDECLWPDLQPLDLATSPYLSHIAEVITFKIEATNEHKIIEFPEVWFPDRYLKQSREATLEMRKKKFDTLEEIDRITKLEERLTNVTFTNSGFFTVKKMFEMSLRHNEASLHDDETQISKEDEKLTETVSVASTNLNTELRKLVESIDKKIDDLSREKDILRADLRQLSTLYTHQSSLPEAPKLTPYWLRGLCTNKNTMYVCQRKNTSDDLLFSQDETKTTTDQWWCIQYSTDSTPVVALQRTTIEEVLIAASKECRNPILVYASERALSVPKIPLPKALQTFVQWDNHLFSTELQEEQAKQDAGSLKTSSFSKLEHQSALSSSNSVKRKFVCGDSDNTGIESCRFERENGVDSVLNELPHQKFGDTLSNVGNIFEKEQESQNLIVGIDPTLIEGCNNSSNSSKNESLCNTRETVDKMDFVFEKK